MTPPRRSRRRSASRRKAAQLQCRLSPSASRCWSGTRSSPATRAHRLHRLRLPVDEVLPPAQPGRRPRRPRRRPRPRNDSRFRLKSVHAAAPMSRLDSVRQPARHQTWLTVPHRRGVVEVEVLTDRQCDRRAARYPDSAVAAPYLFQTRAVPGICVDQLRRIVRLVCTE
jgi:hypothetical protein